MSRPPHPLPAPRRLTRAVAACAAAVIAGCSGTTGDGGTRGAGSAGESVEQVASCTWEGAHEIRTARDVVYASPGGAPQRLDVAWPASPGPHPMVVLLHGGSWTGGDKAAMHDDMLVLAERGYVAAAVGYRLTTGGRNRFPAAVEDVRCAVRWLRANAERYGGDPARIGALGFSAGGHLASMLGTAADARGLDAGCAGADASPMVQAVVSHAGPQDLRVNGPYTEEQAAIVTNFLGAFPGDVPDVAALASPIVHASRGDAPFLLVHGTRDELVPYEHATRMRDTLRAAGVPATVIVLGGQGHVYVPVRSGRYSHVGCTELAFLARWLGPAVDASGR